ncbi:hypothetical protein QTL95_20480 [Rhizobium sp. S152]|uniref:hypothetical protein n=1 Tax=Rhizobium sp. S152 TaxID=3055038 RepID=UPI0025A97C7D|nr:hypothetical protein [Rhizobium sp. S152]MDM9628274.1 hypothetical protein [Rhizobium sp. S152]
MLYFFVLGEVMVTASKRSRTRLRSYATIDEVKVGFAAARIGPILVPSTKASNDDNSLPPAFKRA